eukprot:4090372-Pyramimonas_sp.AAC.1
MLKLVTETHAKASAEDRERTRWKPWSLVRRDLFQEGIQDRKEQVIEFRRRAMSRQYAVEPDPRQKGGFLIAEYQGLFEGT